MAATVRTHLQTHYQMNKHIVDIALSTAMALLFTATGFAQVVPAAPSTPPKETPVELSPFLVSEDSDSGWLATSTLAGSRMNTPLRDTGASIAVMTSEFLRDIGAI